MNRASKLTFPSLAYEGSRTKLFIGQFYQFLMILPTDLNHSSVLHHLVFSLTSCLFITGVHAVLKRGNRISYSLFNLANGKPEPGGVFPAETASFLAKISTTSLRLNTSVVVSLRLLLYSLLYQGLEALSQDLHRTNFIISRLHRVQ